jgi:LmbE family N-acetylglucosaminyl deacetylase
MSETMPKKILSVLAHPDDESFGMGGTLAYYAKMGVEVHLICATKGEAGSMDPEFLEGYDSIASLRESELLCAAKQLGLKNVHFLGYCDSGMEGSAENEHPDAFINAPLEVVTEQVVGYIREFKPDVVLTFDPVGGYHHPDHIHIHKAAKKAFKAAGDPGKFQDAGEPFQPDKLYYHIFPRGFIRTAVKTTWRYWPAMRITLHMSRSITTGLKNSRKKPATAMQASWMPACKARGFFA